MSPHKQARSEAELRADLKRVAKGRGVIVKQRDESAYSINVAGFGNVARALWRAWIKRGWLTDLGEGRFEVSL